MPTYRVTDPTTGRSLKLTGDSPPTDEELEQLFADAGGSSAPSAPPALGEPGDGRQPSGALDSGVGAALTGGILPPEMAQSIGRGAVDASGKLMLGAKELMGLTPPEEASDLRAQLQPQGALETMGSLAPSAAIAATVPGAQGALANAGINAVVGGGLSALESGQAKDALSGAAIAGGGSLAGSLIGRGLANKLGRGIDRNLDMATGVPKDITVPPADWEVAISAATGKAPTPNVIRTTEKFEQVSKIAQAARALGPTLGGVSGAISGGPTGALAGMGGGAVAGEAIAQPISDLMTSPKFNLLSARAKLKVMDTLRSGDAAEIAKVVWRLLPDSSESKQLSNGPTASPTLGDMLSEAKRRRDAQAVISR